jgi:hypothetical protein
MGKLQRIVDFIKGTSSRKENKIRKAFNLWRIKAQGVLLVAVMKARMLKKVQAIQNLVSYTIFFG